MTWMIVLILEDLMEIELSQMNKAFVTQDLEEVYWNKKHEDLRFKASVQEFDEHLDGRYLEKVHIIA